VTKRLAVINTVVLILFLSSVLSAQDLHSSADRFYEKNIERISTTYRSTYTLNLIRNFDKDLIKNFPFGIPTSGCISSEFGSRSNPFNAKFAEFHSGVDIENEAGTPIEAPSDGIVISTGYQGGYGYTVIIKHSETVTSRYAHLREILVTEGEAVKRGDIIGTMGNSGRATGCHLHYEIMLNDKKVDPEAFWGFTL